MCSIAIGFLLIREPFFIAEKLVLMFVKNFFLFIQFKIILYNKKSCKQKDMIIELIKTDTDSVGLALTWHMIEGRKKKN